MDFVSNETPQIQEMLSVLGVDSIEALFDSIPQSLKQPRLSNDDGLSELEVMRLIESIAKENRFSEVDNYLGGGAYAHHIPALVGAITSRSEFLTSYTPYQPEISQGILQAIFEFQSVMANLTGMDVANAGVYDGASACAEAILMALRIQKGKHHLLMAESLQPSYRSVIELYVEGLGVELEFLPVVSGKVDLNACRQVVREDTACLLVQSPNYGGVLEETKALVEIAHEKKALFISCGNPLAYALFQPPGAYGADIAVGDCQPLGLALQFGGPYAGYMTSREDYVRQLPGRIVGQTLDQEGKKGFVLTLQAREQHIRREKATSNICTNQALATLASLITLLWYGPQGLYRLALTNYQRAHYLSEQLKEIAGFHIDEPFFNEFTLHLPYSTERYLDHFRKHQIEPGIPLSDKKKMIVAVTELKTKEQLDRYVETAKQIIL